jgi:hypothetical protein
VIATAKGGPISASNFLGREFRPALVAAGLARVNFHSLRHTAATILASSSTPPGTVHRILGHASFATTMKLYGGLTAPRRSWLAIQPEKDRRDREPSRSVGHTPQRIELGPQGVQGSLRRLPSGGLLFQVHVRHGFAP